MRNKVNYAFGALHAGPDGEQVLAKFQCRNGNHAGKEGKVVSLILHPPPSQSVTSCTKTPSVISVISVLFNCFSFHIEKKAKIDLT